jgi:hypothetical protein
VRGPGDEPGLRGHEEERALREHGDPHDRGAEIELADPPAAADDLEQRRVQRLAALVVDVVQQVAEEDPARREGQRDRHHQHGALAGLGLGLAQDLGAVADRLDAGVGAAAERVGAQEDEREARPAERPEVVAGVPHGRLHHRAEVGRVAEDAPGDEHDVGDEEREEDRDEHADRFLDAAQVQRGEGDHDEHGGGQLESAPFRGQE